MNILHLIFSMRIGGTESMLIDIANEQSNNANVSILIVNDDIDENLTAKLGPAVKLYQLNRRPGARSFWPILKLNFHAIRNHYDIIHCHNYNMIGLLFPTFHRKTFLTIHTTGVPPQFLKRYRTCFAISRAVAQDIKNRSNLHCHVISNGVDFSRIEKKTHSRKKNNNFRIIQVSRLDAEKKGQHIAIEALKLLMERNTSNIVLDFIGAGTSYDALKKQVKDNNLESYVRFLGLRDRDYIYKQLKNYDLLIQPSFYEGFGLTIVEAMAAKIPVLVSNIDGPIEIVQNGKYGSFFECGNAFELSSKIEEVMEMNYTKVDRLVDDSYQYAKRLFSISNTAAKYFELYHNNSNINVQ